MAANSFGDLSERIRLLEEQLEHARKLEAIGLASGIVAHDLNNLLTPILGYATMLRRDLDSDHPLAVGVATIEKAAERAADMINKLMATFLLVGHQSVPVKISSLLDELLEDLVADIPESVELLIQKPSDDVVVSGDPLRLMRMIRNIVCNALEAMPDGGLLKIEADTITLDEEFCRPRAVIKPGSYLCLSIADNGQGIPEDLKKRVNEPFFSTKPVNAGVGMGLPLAFSIVKSHSGTIELNSIQGEGTTVRIYLPATNPQNNP